MSGNVIDVMPLSRKASLLTSVTFPVIATLLILLPPKALSPISVTVEGMVTFSRELRKALRPILVMPLGISKFIILLPKNALSGISVHESGIVTSSILQSKNEDVAEFTTESGMTSFLISAR